MELLDQKLTHYIAQFATVDKSVVARFDERCDPLIDRSAKVFWRGSHERMLPLDDNRFFDTDAMVRLASKIIEDAGAKGKCVIVGRGSPYILRNRPDRFSVFCYASRDAKIERLVSLKTPRAEAEESSGSHRSGARDIYQALLRQGLAVPPAVQHDAQHGYRHRARRRHDPFRHENHR